MILPLSDFSPRIGEMIGLLKELVEIESPTNEKAAVARVREWISRQLFSLGAQVKIEPQEAVGDHVIGRWGMDLNPKDRIVLLFHMDTVHPMGSILTNPCREHGGKLFGPGVQDMKSGIVLFFIAAKVLQKRGIWPATPVTALFTSDEETGSETSRSLIENLASQSSLVLCMEPSLPDGALKTWRKGVGDYEVIVKGRAAHAGAAHSEGINAIEELAYQIVQIQGWTNYDLGTTLNDGLILGGTASNVVPAEASAVVDLRVMTPEEAARIEEPFHSLQPFLNGATITVQGGLNRPPMPRDARMVATFQRAQRLASELGLTLEEGGTGGGSDANFVAPLGVPVLDGLGAIGGGQHTEREFILVDRLPERAALLAALISGW